MEKLRVAPNGTVVGMLEKHAGGAMSFVYQEEWLARAISLSLPLKPEPFRGDVVYNFFDNLLPETTYRMTPLYDVLSDYPFMHARGIAPQKAKMAMAALGKGRHYRWSQILPRHFISTARVVGYSEEKTLQVMAELKAQTEQAIANVEAMLPDDFPRSVSDAIFAGVRRQACRLPG
jgi:HipA-like protein